MTRPDFNRRHILASLLAAPALPALLAACAREPEEPHEVAEAPSEPPQIAEPEPAPPPVDADARQQLAGQIETIGEGFGGTLGIAVQDVETGWSAGFNEGMLLPQQSVSKLWVALTLLSQVDSGEMTLSRPITVTRNDLTLFHQPVRKEVLQGGSVTLSAREWIERALTKSDNTANDALLNQVGGSDAVRATLAEKGLDGIRFGPGERRMQSAIAGLDWDQAYSIENKFYDARDEVPDKQRKIAFEAYLSNPVDGAKPAAIADALSRLAKGKLLSPKSTAFLVDTLKKTSSGPRRLKGGVAAGWNIAHKTGTGQFYDQEQSGYNDVGLIFSPDGRAYAMAVQIGRTSKPTISRMEMMQDVTRAVIAFEDNRKQAVAAAEAEIAGNSVESEGRTG